MRRSAVATDLEIVDLDGAPLGVRAVSAGRGRSRRWPIAFVASVLTVVGLALPGRTQVAATEFRRLEGAWTEFTADEAGHRDAIAAVWFVALAPDQVLVNEAILNLDREESGRLAALDHRLGGMLLVDGGLTRLRASMRRVVGLQVAVLRRAERIRLMSQMGPVQSVEAGSSVAPAVAQVAALLSSERDHFGLTRVAVGPRVQPYRAADGVMAAMTSDERESRRAFAVFTVARPRRGRIPLPF